MKRLFCCAIAICSTSALVAVSPARAADASAPPTDPFLFAYDGGTIKIGIDAALAGFHSDNTYWSLVRAVAPGAKVDHDWLEGAAEISLAFDHHVTDTLSVYGGTSGIFTFTLDEDIFETKDVSFLTYDDLYGGFRVGERGDNFYFDVSGGSQPYVAGTGMFIGDGAPEGSVRGAVTYAPFAAWDIAAILRVGSGPFIAEAFYLDADEIYTPDTDTTMAGGNVRFTKDSDNFVGIMGGVVLESNAPSFQALPGFAGSVQIEDGREHLKFLNAYAKWKPELESLPGLFMAGDFSYQWNEDIDLKAWAARGAVGYTFAELPFRPTLTYSYQTYSGDDPSTSDIERFDPILGGSSPAYFGLGANSALLLSSSNVSVHRIGLQTVLTEQDFLNFSYYHLRTNEVNSPLTIDSNPSGSGLGAVPPAFNIGSKEFANEFSVDYTHAFTPNIFFSTSLNYSIPGEGLQDFGGGDFEDWFAANAVIAVKF